MGSKKPLRNKLKSILSEKLVCSAVPKSSVLNEFGLSRRVVALSVIISGPISSISCSKWSKMEVRFFISKCDTCRWGSPFSSVKRLFE